MIFLRLLNPLGLDFRVYYEAAWMIIRGLNPYRGILISAFPFNYPPPAFLFLFPLGLLAYREASIIWNLLSVISLVIAIFLIFRVAFPTGKKLFFLIFLFLFTLPFFPVKFNIGMGQINNFILLFSVLSLFLYQRNHKLLSAFFLAFATGIKLAPVIFVFYFLINKDYRQVLRFLICLLVVFALPIVLVPLSFQTDYFLKVLPLSFNLNAKDWYYNQSVWGLAARSFSRPPVIYIFSYFFTAVFLEVTYWRGRKIPGLRALGAVACLYLLIHPIALQHYFGFTIIPFIILTADFLKKGTIPEWFFLFIAYFLTAVNIKNFASVPAEYKIILSHDFFGVLLLWLLLLFKEKAVKIVGWLWVSGITAGYILILLCRGRICF